MKRVLFLCTGNSARSQIAEALLRHLGGDSYDVHSAGTDISSEVNPLAIQVLKERGISIEGLYPKGLNEYAGIPFDIVITVCDSAKQSCPYFPGARKTIHWSIEDPAAYQGRYEEMLLVFRETLEEIENRIRTSLLRP